MVAAGVLLIGIGLLCLLLNKPLTGLVHTILGEDLARVGGYSRDPRTGRALSVTVVGTLAALVGLGLAVAGLLGS